MNLTLTGKNNFIYKVLERGFVEAHILDNFEFNVAKIEDLKQNYKDAIKKEHSLSMLKDSNIILRFVRKVDKSKMQDQATQDNQASQDSKEQGEEDQAIKESLNRLYEDEGLIGLYEDEEEDDVDRSYGNDINVEKVKSDILKTIKRCLYLDENKDDEENKIELYDLTFKGAPTYFAKINLTDFK